MNDKKNSDRALPRRHGVQHSIAERDCLHPREEAGGATCAHACTEDGPTAGAAVALTEGDSVDLLP